MSNSSYKIYASEEYVNNIKTQVDNDITSLSEVYTTKDEVQSFNYLLTSTSALKWNGDATDRDIVLVYNENDIYDRMVHSSRFIESNISNNSGN